MSLALTKIGNCFDYSRKDPQNHDIDNLFAVLNIDYVYENAGSKNGTLSLIFNDKYSPTYEFRTGIFQFSKEMTGRFWHQDGFGKVFEAGCLVTDLNNNVSHMCYFEGGDFTNSWCGMSIARDFVKFLNKLVQFESLEDYIIYEEANKRVEWYNKDLSDKILQLAKIIELYKKYYTINRALSITHKMEVLIESRLESLLKNNEKSKKGS